MDTYTRGKLGGQARAARMTPEQRSEAAAHASRVRFGTKRGEANLIPILSDRVGQRLIQTVDGRALHAFLELGKDYSNWIKTAIARARLVEDRDYVIQKDNSTECNFAQKGVANDAVKQGIRPIEYHLSIDAAVHIGMMSNTERGFEVREYFIQKEKELRERAMVDSFLGGQGKPYFFGLNGDHAPGANFTFEFLQDFCRVYGFEPPKKPGDPSPQAIAGLYDTFIYKTLPLEVRQAINDYDPRETKTSETTGNVTSSRRHKVYQQLTPEKINQFLKVRIDQVHTALRVALLAKKDRVRVFREFLAQEDRRRGIKVHVYLNPQTTVVLDLLCANEQLSMFDDMLAQETPLAL